MRIIPRITRAACLLAGAVLILHSCQTKKGDAAGQENEPRAVVNVQDSVYKRIRVEVEAEILERYAGDYELLLDPSNYFSISVDSGNLLFHSANAEPVVFEPENDTAFFSDPASTETLAFVKRGELYNFIMMNEKGYKLEARHLP